MVNKFPGRCACGKLVAKGTGIVSKVDGKWIVSCGASCGGARSMAITFNSGETIYQNSRGRCEDAPCCGCCT